MTPLRVAAGLVIAVVLTAVSEGRLVAGSGAGRASAASLDCKGDERWQIKTLTNAQAGDVNTTATTTTVEALRQNDTRPEKVSSKVNRIAPLEFRRLRIHATLRKAIREDDGDLHVVIADPAHDAEADPEQTLIIEFPDASCEPQKSSSYATQMASAREAFVALVTRCTGYAGNFGSLRQFKLHATVTGVGFWDVKHGTPQLGHAPNDLELHPVLKVTQATCA
jgi:hypothetical protein